ncbi:MAG: tyrosine-type recombinase/integrase [Bacteroidales bacterium]|nr:tyrosine-type recombinase/integrase [Bacteroidales bacterium]
MYNRYNGKIPFISNQKYNLFLKVLAERAGINKNFHTHLFRHTYCTLLLNKGVSMKTVSRCAGHSSSITTESFYAFLKEETILEEVSKAIEKLDF